VVTLSLYEHLRRLSTSETLTILKPLVPNFSLATPNKNHGWVTLILYEHPRRPSTTEILTILGLRSSKLEKLFLTGFFGRHFAFLTKTSVAEDLSWRLRMKMKMHMQLKSTRIKMVHVDSRRHSNFSETPKMVFSLGGKWLENNLKRSWKWRCKQSFAFARTFRQSIVKSKILPIVFVEDTPMKFSSKTYQLRRWCQILVQLSLSLYHLNYVYVWLIDQINLFQPT
jgi:hypothetical protein